MDVTTLTDAEGQEIGNEIIRIGREEGGGTLDYRWENPTTGEVEDKSTYIEPVGDDVVCAVGYYQE
jgi:signal transduction histidine kinase